MTSELGGWRDIGRYFQISNWYYLIDSIPWGAREVLIAGCYTSCFESVTLFKHPEWIQEIADDCTMIYGKLNCNIPAVSHTGPICLCVFCFCV